jgi:hypothetical protein
MLKHKSWVEEANEYISIFDLLSSIGVYIPFSDGSSTKKIHCPFGFYHSDGGTSKAMRVYSHSNTAYCFSCGKRYSPVGLASAYWDCSYTAAALRLLEDAGFKSKTLEERWVEATTPEKNKIDLIALADALKMYCAGICTDWDTLQYSDKVSVTLSRCLGLLNSVHSEEQATKWLTTCKTVMKTILEG